MVCKVHGQKVPYFLQIYLEVSLTYSKFSLIDPYRVKGVVIEKLLLTLK